VFSIFSSNDIVDKMDNPKLDMLALIWLLPCVNFINTVYHTFEKLLLGKEQVIIVQKINFYLISQCKNLGYRNPIIAKNSQNCFYEIETRLLCFLINGQI
jgi:hypothetical protein